MQELLMNAVQSAKYAIYKDGVATDADSTVVVKLFKDEVQVATGSAVRDAAGRYSYAIPSQATVDSTTYNILGVEGELKIVWSFAVSSNQFEVSEEYQVVTPYCHWAYFDGKGYNYNDFLEAERVARFVINAHCGQAFGKEEATYLVEGNGQSSLILPARLLELEEFTYFEELPRPGRVIGMTDENWEITADGWVIRHQPQRRHLNVVYDYKPKFLRNRHYTIKGFWGWNSVPANVQEAAKIIIADYLCAGHKYRDKYLQEISMNDWKMKFHDRAFSSTGNATADSLLIEYRLAPGIGMI